MPADLERAERAYQAAVFGDETADLEPALAALTGADPATLTARGMLLHCRALTGDRTPDSAELDCFERAALGFAAVGDRRGVARATFWQGCYHQVLAQDAATAVPLLEQAAELARAHGDELWLSYALRHLGAAAHAAGDLAAARALLEESTTLRRDLGFDAGVAANLVGLAHVAIAQDDRERAAALAHEAIDIAHRCEAPTMAGFGREALSAARPAEQNSRFVPFGDTAGGICHW